MKLTPLADRVVLKMTEAEETTKGGIIPVSYTHLCAASCGPIPPSRRP